jgi:hypothetical protein
MYALGEKDKGKIDFNETYKTKFLNLLSKRALPFKGSKKIPL